MSQNDQVAQIDVRHIQPSHRHSTIFGVLTSLKPGGAMQVTVDHDPVPLRHQINARYPDQFGWLYLEQGPDLWKVQISRAESSCCGGCGGH